MPATATALGVRGPLRIRECSSLIVTLSEADVICIALYHLRWPRAVARTAGTESDRSRSFVTTHLSLLRVPRDPWAPTNIASRCLLPAHSRVSPTISPNEVRPWTAIAERISVSLLLVDGNRNYERNAC